MSKFSDYALRASLYLGANDQRFVPIAEIVRAHELSQPNLMKVVNALVDGGILKSLRGRNGGVALARPASEIRLGEIVRVMEGDKALINCSDCRLAAGTCGIVPMLCEAEAAFYDALNRHTLADALASTHA